MPWPFRRHRAQDAGTSAASATSEPPVTIEDLSGRRRLTVHAGGWQHLEPLTPAATGAAAPVVGSSASFIAGLAGTRPIIPASSLRDVSPDAPRGVTRGLARPLPPDPFPPPPEGTDASAMSAEQFADQEPAHRPVVAGGASPHPDLTTYTGDLTPVAFEPEVYIGADVLDDEMPEELPPPIFSSLLAERTGRDLTDLRPDLAETDEIGGAGHGETPEVMQATRRRSLAESRRLGLGAPLPSGPFDVGNREHLGEPVIEIDPAPEPAAPPPEAFEPPEPSRRAIAYYRRSEVPPGVRTDVTRALGRDPGAVRIRRDRDVSDIASRIGARAFTREGEVFLPIEAGPLDAPETRALLAHELTHVVQQRVYGSSLPRPSSAEGQRLEAEAHAVERFIRGDDPAPRIAPLRTLRATPGDPRVDSGGFTRSVTEQLVARGAAHVDADGALVFRPPQSASEEWRASSDASTSEAFRNALQQDQRATLDYSLSRGATQAADRDRAENERHLRFVHDWQGQLNEAGATSSTDAQASLRYEQTRSPSPSAASDSQEFERHLEYVKREGGGEGDEDIFIEQGGLGTALGLTSGLGGIFSHYDDTQERIARDNERHRVEALRASAGQGGAQGTPGTGGTGTPMTGTSTPVGTGTPQAGTGSAPASHPTTPGGRPAPGGGTEEHYEPDEDIQIAEGGLRDALGLVASVTAHSDVDLFHDSTFGMHKVPAQPATTPTATPPATPAPGVGAPTPTVVTPETPAVTATGVAVAAGAAAAAATHHELAAAGTKARERSIDGTDPTDMIAHLDDQDLEDLAALLFDRLQTRLRRDLIVDRERSGFLTDFR